MLSRIEQANWNPEEGILAIPEKYVAIAGYTFSKLIALKAVYFPSKLTTIEDETFSGCTGLQTLNLPDECTSICKYAFSECSGLQSIKFPDGLRSIGAGAFQKCTSIQTLRFPEKLAAIYNMAFYGCTGLHTIILPEGFQVAIDSGIFRDSNIHTVIIESNDKAEIARISSLLPFGLQDKVVSLDMAEKSKKIREAQLSCVMGIPQFHTLHNYSNNLTFFGSSLIQKIPMDVLPQIMRNSKEYLNIERLLLQEPLPKNESQLQDYTHNLEKIVTNRLQELSQDSVDLKNTLM